MRNIATRYDEPKQALPFRRTSLPAVAFSASDTMFNAHKGEDEEEAVAGRLEIRVVDATGGATIVQTSADREPLQSMCVTNYFSSQFFIYLFFLFCKLASHLSITLCAYKYDIIYLNL